MRPIVARLLVLTKMRPSGGLNATPPQLPPPMVPLNTTDMFVKAYGVYAPSLYICSLSHHAVQNWFDSGVTVVRSAFVMPSRAHGAGLTGNGCVGDAFSPGTWLAGTFRSSTPKIALPVSRARMNSLPPIFVTCATAGIRVPLRPTMGGMLFILDR